jgi:hypothetical protein
MSSFNYYPSILYNSQVSKNLLIKNVFINSAFNDYKKFYSYIIKEGERPDIIAYQEYGDSSLDWVIYLINGVIDPYSDWIMDDKQLRSYLEDKYNTAAEKLTSTVIASSIAYYYYAGLNSDSEATINSYNYNMTAETYAKLNSPAGWIPKSIYDYESELNEAKREINLLRPIYIQQFKQQFDELING